MHTDTSGADVADWYRRYGTAIHGYIMARTRDTDVADDCTSLTFLRAFARRESFTDRGGGVRPWLFTIARNVVHDHLKARGREVPLADVDGGVDRAPSPEEKALLRELREVLDRRIGQLPPDQARCVRLRFLDELSVAETAREMDRAEIAVRALQYRAVRELRAAVAA